MEKRKKKQNNPKRFKILPILSISYINWKKDVSILITFVVHTTSFFGIGMWYIARSHFSRGGTHFFSIGSRDWIRYYLKRDYNNITKREKKKRTDKYV